MVQFGRHIEYYVSNELDPSRRLYVVPYKDMQRRTCLELVPEQQQQQQHLLSAPPPPPPPPLSMSTSASHRSGLLSALFDNYNDGNDNDTMDSSNLVPTSTSASGAIIANPTSLSSSINNANAASITITTSTGAELAAAVKSILITQRQERHQQPQHRSSEVIVDQIDDDGQEEEGGDIMEDNIERLESNDFSGDGDINYINSEEEGAETQANFFAQRFQTEFRICLKRATADFDRAMQLFWCEVFAGMKDYKQIIDESGATNSSSTEATKANNEMDYEIIRGALPDAALRTYVLAVPTERAHETFSFLKDIHSTALINAEALRKLVKKFDKKMQHSSFTVSSNHHDHHHSSYLLSAKLLPEVYASNFTGSLASLEGGLALLRVLLNIDEEDYSHANFNAPAASSQLHKSSSASATNKDDDDMREVAILREGYLGNKNDKETDDQLVIKRKKELHWLRSMIESIDPIYVPFLVGHRGFHSVHDRSDVRPLENSLTAYEAAWTNGVHLCECDIALTKDERMILAHDENFARLGMDPSSPLCNRTVRDLTFQELMNCPLKSGARPPLLFDVLRSAAAIGGNAKMIVEIKAGNTDAASALARMFARHPKLMEHVAVVMSFDAFIMHNMRKEMAAVFEQLHGSTQPQTTSQQQHGPASPNYHVHGDKSPVSDSFLPNDNAPPVIEHAVHIHPLPVLSNIALGSTLSSSPNLGPSILSQSRLPSHGRFPSILGSSQRLETRDLFGLGHSGVGHDKGTDIGVGLNLADVRTPIISSSKTFLPIHKPHEDDAVPMMEKGDRRLSSSPFMTDKPMVPTFPKLLLITVAEAPKVDYQLFVDFTQPENVEKLLRGGDGGSLDGVYMQYQKEMIRPEFSKAMRSLASRYDVGVWGTDPDEWDTFHTLVTECHVSFVNSSLPKNFLRKMKRSISANSLAMNGILSSHLSGM